MMASHRSDRQSATEGRSASADGCAEKMDALLARLMLPLRLVLAWVFLAAVWRRLVLAPAKHDPESPAWLGHKINTFFPHATWPVHDVLEWLLQRPRLLDVFTWIFTASEGIVGLALLLGILSRFTGLLVVGLGAGLMHTSGWLGPTCLSEWHTASLLVTGGAMLAFFGAGSHSMDYILERNGLVPSGRRWWVVMARPQSPSVSVGSRWTTAWAAGLTAYVMSMNQVHHGGVWGPLHNHSKVPGIRVSNADLDASGRLRFRVFRDRGPEAWGTHVVRVGLVDASGREVWAWNGSELAELPASALRNDFVNRVHSGPHGLVVPLGARATIRLSLPNGLDLDAESPHRVRLEEVGGMQFTSPDFRVFPPGDSKS